jgi:hypothetical protein
MAGSRPDERSGRRTLEGRSEGSWRSRVGGAARSQDPLARFRTTLLGLTVPNCRDADQPALTSSIAGTGRRRGSRFEVRCRRSCDVDSAAGRLRRAAAQLLPRGRPPDRRVARILHLGSNHRSAHSARKRDQPSVTAGLAMASFPSTLNRARPTFRTGRGRLEVANWRSIWLGRVSGHHAQSYAAEVCFTRRLR